MNMNSWWSEKNGREQRSLIFLAVFCLLAGFWYGVVQPLDNAIAQQGEENDRLRSEIQWVNEAIQRRGLVAGRPGTKTDPALIQHSAQQADLNISVVTSTPDHFAISLPVVKTEPLFAWLNTLQNEGIQVSQLTFSARPVAGEIAVEALELYPVGK